MEENYCNCLQYHEGEMDPAMRGSPSGLTAVWQRDTLTSGKGITGPVPGSGSIGTDWSGEVDDATCS